MRVLGHNRRRRAFGFFAALALGWLGTLVQAQPQNRGVIFEKTSPYHHILVVDSAGIRTLSFDGSMETRMSLFDPLKGHFEYTEFFHLPWVWNPSVSNVLMIGLGGASTQRAYQHYYPNVHVDTVEIDPVVVQVAKGYFQLRETTNLTVHLEDGRMYLQRCTTNYDVIILDAYSRNRYGSFIPYHLITQEFFRLANQHLSAQGVLAYNVITEWQSWRAPLLAAVYQTMKSVFPQVYLFPARSSQNVVLIATKSRTPVPGLALVRRASDLAKSGRVTMPNFMFRFQSLRVDAPEAPGRSLVLTDDYAPIDTLALGGGQAPSNPPAAAPSARPR